MDAVKICQACGKGNMAQQTECYFCHWKKFSKTYYNEAPKPEAVKSKSNDGLARKFCVWEKEEIQDHWETECGMEFIVLEGSPEDNGMVYCTYCGGELKTAC